MGQNKVKMVSLSS